MRLFLLSNLRLFGLRPGISASPGEILSWISGRGTGGTQTGSFLYVISDALGHCKVGVSEDPNRRLRELQTGHPLPLRLSWAAVTPGSGYAIEAHVKRTTGHMRMSGEWFRTTPETLAFLVMQAGSILNEPVLAVPPDRVAEIVQTARTAWQEPRALPFRLRRPFLTTFLLVISFTVVIFWLLRAAGT